MLSKRQKHLESLNFDSIHGHMALLLVPKQTSQLELHINLKTFNIEFYRWLVKIMSSESIYFFYPHIFSEENLRINYLIKKI